MESERAISGEIVSEITSMDYAIDDNVRGFLMKMSNLNGKLKDMDMDFSN